MGAFYHVHVAGFWPRRSCASCACDISVSIHVIPGQNDEFGGLLNKILYIVFLSRAQVSYQKLRNFFRIQEIA